MFRNYTWFVSRKEDLLRNRHLSALCIAVIFCSTLLISLHSRHADIEASNGCAICKCADDLNSADKTTPGLPIALYLILMALHFESLIKAMRVPAVPVISRAPPSFSHLHTDITSR